LGTSVRPVPKSRRNGRKHGEKADQALTSGGATTRAIEPKAAVERASALTLTEQVRVGDLLDAREARAPISSGA